MSASLSFKETPPTGSVGMLPCASMMMSSTSLLLSGTERFSSLWLSSSWRAGAGGSKLTGALSQRSACKAARPRGNKLAGIEPSARCWQANKVLKRSIRFDNSRTLPGQW